MKKEMESLKTKCINLENKIVVVSWYSFNKLSYKELMN